MAGQSGNCQISGEYCISLDEHHIIPREFGGEDGPTILLSPTIHQALHRVYDDPSRLDEFANTYSKSTSIIYYLAKCLQECKSNFNKVQSRKITLVFSDKELAVLTHAANELNITVAQVAKQIIQRVLDKLVEN